MSRYQQAVVRPDVVVILEEGPTTWGAFVPSIPGCFAGGSTREEAEHNIERAITLHLGSIHHEELTKEAGSDSDAAMHSRQ